MKIHTCQFTSPIMHKGAYWMKCYCCDNIRDSYLSDGSNTIENLNCFINLWWSMKKKFGITLILILIHVISYSQVRRDYTYHALEISYIGLQVSDVVTTKRALELGGEELNPFMKTMIDKKLFIPSKVILTGAVLSGCRWIKRDNKIAGYACLIAFNVLQTAVLYNNYQVCLKLKI